MQKKIKEGRSQGTGQQDEEGQKINGSPQTDCLRFILGL